MGKISVETCGIEGLKIITPAVFGDERGYFSETYNYRDYKEAGIPEVFVQDNQSASRKGVLFPQGKLVRVIRGEVYDVAVDIRSGSPTFGKWYGVLLSEENKKQFFVRSKTGSEFQGISRRDCLYIHTQQRKFVCRKFGDISILVKTNDIDAFCL